MVLVVPQLCLSSACLVVDLGPSEALARMDGFLVDLGPGAFSLDLCLERDLIGTCHTQSQVSVSLARSSLWSRLPLFRLHVSRTWSATPYPRPRQSHPYPRIAICLEVEVLVEKA